MIPVLARERPHQVRGTGAGFSLVECLIGNALALALVSLLVSVSADVIATVRLAAERSDQSLRLRQVHRFLDTALLTAKMPADWIVNAVESVPSSQWQSPADPCVSPAALGDRSQWGGLTIIDLANTPCLPGATAGYGLYVERVIPCPQDCKQRSGYRVMPADCQTHQWGEVRTNRQWRAEWQDVLSHPAGCPGHAPWGRVERLLLSHRAAADASHSQSELRLQLMASGPEYRWTPAETLVTGIQDWQISQFELPVLLPPLTAKTAYDSSPVPVDQSPRYLLQLTLSAASHHFQHQLPPMPSTRVLVPSRE